MRRIFPLGIGVEKPHTLRRRQNAHRRSERKGTKRARLQGTFGFVVPLELLLHLLRDPVATARPREQWSDDSYCPRTGGVDGASSRLLRQTRTDHRVQVGSGEVGGFRRIGSATSRITDWTVRGM